MPQGHRLPRVTRRQIGICAAIAAVTAVAGILHYAGASAVVTFVVAGLALAGLAWIVAFATERSGSASARAATGFLQSTLGNLPEFFIVLFALQKGEVLVAQTSLIGSVFANGLLVLGITIMIGRATAGTA